MFLGKVSLNHHISMKEEKKNKSLTYSKHFNKKVTSFKMMCSCNENLEAKRFLVVWVLYWQHILQVL